MVRRRALGALLLAALAWGAVLAGKPCTGCAPVALSKPCPGC